MRNRFWTQDEDRILKKMAGNYSTKEIAEKLNRTQSSVNARAFDKKVSLRLYGEKHSRHKYSNAIVEKARNLYYEKGMKLKEIRILTNIEKNTLYKIINYTHRTHDPIRA